MNNAVANDAAAPADRQVFYDRIAEHNLAPLRESLHQLVTHTPAAAAVPVHRD